MAKLISVDSRQKLIIIHNERKVHIIMLDAVRKSCPAGEKAEFHFKASSIAYRVKNFTSGPIIVCLRTWDDSQSIMVAAGMAETVISNPDPSNMMQRGTTSTVIVQAEQTGIVEVIRDD